VQVLLQSGRLLITEALPEAGALVRELLSFQNRITASTHDAYDAWREGAHDDLVLAVALTCWWGECTPGRGWLRYVQQLSEKGATPDEQKTYSRGQRT
jgi:hypothetical protein